MRLLKTGCLALMLLWSSVAAAQTMAPPKALQNDAGDYIQSYDNGTINWETGVVTAVGIGAPPGNAVNTAQARAMAIRSAKVIARRNLLELLKGVQIDSQTTVQNFIVADDIAISQVRGYLKNAKILDTAYMSDGSVEVKVGVRLRSGFADVLLPREPKPDPAWTPKPTPTPMIKPMAIATPKPIAVPTPKPPSRPAIPGDVGATTAFHSGYTGLVIDARGLSARPAMSPRVFDENGNEVYGSAFVARDYAIQQGMAGYAKDINKAAGNPRVGENPLVVKAKAVQGASRTDLVLSNADADSLRRIAENSKMLEQTRVMIVLD